MAKHTSRTQTAEEVVLAKIERFAARKGVSASEVGYSFLWGCYVKKKFLKKPAKKKAMRRRASGGPF